MVFQGPWTGSTAVNIHTAKKALPGSKVILSTFVNEMKNISNSGADLEVFSTDPGGLPSYKLAKGAPENNINRQILTSQRGLSFAKTTYAAKIRTDCTLYARSFIDFYQRIRALYPSHDRIVASSFYTLHPAGIEGFPFHVSDWFFFGATRQLREFWNVSQMTREDATWFDRVRHHRKSSYFARLYRSRLTPEQYLSVAYGSRKGYKTPDFINDDKEEIVVDYEKFLVQEFAISSPEDLGLLVPKYSHLIHSNYQFFNCVSWEDWAGFQEKHDGKSCSPALLLSPTEVKRIAATKFMRKLDFALPAMKKVGAMPLIGKLLGLYRQSNKIRESINA